MLDLARPTWCGLAATLAAPVPRCCRPSAVSEPFVRKPPLQAVALGLRPGGKSIEWAVRDAATTWQRRKLRGGFAARARGQGVSAAIEDYAGSNGSGEDGKVAPFGHEDLSASALVTGTAIGGGFLALPYTVTPAGFGPSAAVMVGVWLFLFIQSTVLADLVVAERRRTGAPTSIPTVARRTLGRPGSVGVGALFLIYCLATSVAQFAKAGQLLRSIGGVPYTLGAILTVTTLGSFTFCSPTEVTGWANLLVACGFVVSAGFLAHVGVPLANWNNLMRVDWAVCLRCVPTVLQLFVFLEVTPVICSLLHYDTRRVRRAVLVGSGAMLLFELAWSALGISMVPFHPLLRSDPVDVLLGSGGHVSTSAAVLGLCAVVTTIISVNLALKAFFRDLCASRRHFIMPSFVAASLLPLLVALASPDGFFAVLDFAGAYPVALLWGCTPPLMAFGAMRLATGTVRPKRGQRLLLSVLLGASLLVVGCSTGGHVMRFLGRAGIATLHG